MRLATAPLAGLPQRAGRAGHQKSRKTSFKPYRIVYRVLEHKVYIHLIADGRRDLQSLLARRLLGA